MGVWSRFVTRFDAAFESLRAWDERTVLAVSEYPALRRFSRVFVTASYLGDGYLWGGIGLGLILFGGPADRVHVLIGVGITIVNVAVFRFLKALVGRRRPDSNGGKTRFRTIDSYALPSGHATTSFGLAWLVSRIHPHPVAIVLVYAAATTIAFSRVFVRDHYPMDVIVGALLGTITSALLLPLFRWAF